MKHQAVQAPNQRNNVTRSRTAKFLQQAAILILCLLLLIVLLRGSYVTIFSRQPLRVPWAPSQQDLENGKEELQAKDPIYGLTHHHQ
jgi:hypothetical protein